MSEPKVKYKRISLRDLVEDAEPGYRERSEPSYEFSGGRKFVKRDQRVKEA